MLSTRHILLLTKAEELWRNGGFIGSLGSITCAALKVATCPENKGKLILSVICDFGERYLSNPVYAELPDPDYSDIDKALG